MAADDLDDIAARGSYRSSPAPVEGAGRLTRRPESRRHSSTSSGGAARTSRDFVETVRSAMAVDDSADLRREEAAVLSPAPTEPHPVAPVSYNVQRLATRRQARTITGHAPPDLNQVVHVPARLKRRVPRSARSARRRQPHCYLTLGELVHPPRRPDPVHSGGSRSFQSSGS